MKKEDPKLMLICFPFKEKDNLTKGKAANCSSCNSLVWSSDSSFERMKENFPHIDFEKNPVEILCVKCGVIKTTMQSLLGKDVELRPPTPEQLSEIRTYRNKNNPNVN